MSLLPEQLTVVVPVGTGRALPRTLAALADQTVRGFATMVVANSDEVDASVSRAMSSHVWIRGPGGGPGAARTHAANVAETPLVLFLSDDMVPDPDLVAQHLSQHERGQGHLSAVVGRTEWHPEVRADPVQRWMTRAGLGFPLGRTDGRAVEPTLFRCSNVSIPREVLVRTAVFDDELRTYCADVDAGWRLEQSGVPVRVQPRAVARHLHHYDWTDLRDLFTLIGSEEWAMASRYSWFHPRVHDQSIRALAEPLRSPGWIRASGTTRGQPTLLRRFSERRADDAYLQQLGPLALNAWDGRRGVAELQTYLAENFDPQKLNDHRRLVDEEELAASDEASFYRSSEAYLYDLTAFNMWDTKVPYLEDLCRFVSHGCRILDYGCGIGSDGLRLIERGYRVEFADFSNPSTAFLQWRLRERGLVASVHDVDQDIPHGFDAAFAFDVIEHVDDPFHFLDQLESRATTIAVNFLEPDPADTHLHKPLPINRLLDHCEARGLLRYRKYHGRSHLVIYRPSAGRTAAARLQRRCGPLLGRSMAFAERSGVPFVEALGRRARVLGAALGRRTGRS